MPDPQANPYLAYRVARKNPRMRLFCFPYAGGNATMFQRWQRAFPEFIEICPLQYPGRGNRMRDTPFTSLVPLAHDVSKAIETLLDLPFAFFGHSMGALIEFEVARDFRRKQKPLPRHLFASASRAPQAPYGDTISFDLPTPVFLEELRRLNGTPLEVLENAELMELMLPMLRADFSVAQTYLCVEEPPLACPFSVYGGTDDRSVTKNELEEWCQQTTGSCSVQLFAGDHFYLHAAEKALTERIALELTRIVTGPALR